MYPLRDFEFNSIRTDTAERKSKVQEFLIEQQASNRNLIYTESHMYIINEAIDLNWQGALP